MSPCTSDNFRIIYNQVQWVERYLYEIDCISKQATLEPNKRSPAAVAPHFFNMLYCLLFDASILEAAKLLDPPEQHGHKNICLKSVIRDADWLNDETRKQKLQTLCNIRKKYLEKIKNSRNKFLAHADYKAVTERNDPATHGNHIRLCELKYAVSLIRDLVDTIRPDGVQMAPRPIDDKNWLGVSVVLEVLSRSCDC